MTSVIGRSRERGMALVIALIFLTVLTLLGVTALSSSTLQLRMAFGAGEDVTAFHAAETALSAGENWLGSRRDRPVAACTTRCNTTAANATLVWERPATGAAQITRAQFFNESWWLANGRLFGYRYEDDTVPAAVAGQAFEDSQAPPRYVVEDLGPDISGSLVMGQGRRYQVVDYQISARGYGVHEGTRTVVQSVYGKGF